MAGKWWYASRERCRSRNRSSQPYGQKAPAAWPVLPAADKPSHNGSSGGRIRAIPWRAIRRYTCSSLVVGPITHAWRDRESIRRTRTPAKWSGRSKPRTRPTPAGCEISASTPIVFGYGNSQYSKPRTAQVKQREHAGASHREQRHGFSEAVDRIAPRLPQQQKNGGDQRAGVADTDPPDEVDDGESPADGNVDAPDADALGEQLIMPPAGTCSMKADRRTPNSQPR